MVFRNIIRKEKRIPASADEPESSMA
jgi:hypothetical protein